MACRIRKDRFAMMVAQEAGAHEVHHAEIEQGDPINAFNMVSVEGGFAILNRKAIQSLVDEAEQARPIIRNLLRWAKEHGAE